MDALVLSLGVLRLLWVFFELRVLSLLPYGHVVPVALSNRDFPPGGVGSEGWTAAVSARGPYH